jgi:KDO2-lipid IV(A) lauroyltransferase
LEKARPTTATRDAPAAVAKPRAFLTPLDLAYLVYLYPGRLAARILPPPLFMRGCQALIRLILPAFGGARRRVARSMRAAFPAATEQQVQAWAAAAVEGFLVRAAQDLVTRRLVAGGHPGEAKVEGAEHLEAALAAGRGAVVCSGHFLATRLARCWLAARGFPMLVTRRGVPPPRSVSRWGHRVLQVAYDRVLHEVIRDEVLVGQRSSTLRVLRHLRDGGIVYANLDASLRGRSTTHPLLGSLKEFGTGLLEMIHLTGVPLVPAEFVGDWRRLHITFLAPLALVEAPDGKAFARENLGRVVATLEGLIRRHPDQWEYWVLGWPAPLAQDVFGR